MRALLLRRPEVTALAAAVPLVLLLLPGSVPTGVLLLGVVQAAPLALHAAGIVLVHRSNRFVDFAQLQIGAVAATLFALLSNAQPLPRALDAACSQCFDRITPGFYSGQYWTALVVCLLLAAGTGWLAYAAVFRLLDRAPRLVATVASIFLVTALAAVQRGLVAGLSSEEQRSLYDVVAPVPPPQSRAFALRVGEVRFSVADLLVVAAAVVLLTGVGLWLRRSRTGTEVRAAAESPDRAASLGVDVRRVTGRVWLVVGLLSGTAALTGAMSSPAGSGESPASASSLVRILLVAVVARFASLAVTAFAAVALGVVTAAVQFSTGSTGVLDGALVVVLAVLLLLTRRDAARADRDTSSAYLTGRQARRVPAALRDLPEVRRARRLGGAGLVAGVAALPLLLSPSQTSLVTSTMVLAVVGLSLLVLTGWAGQVSLGQFALAAVGAWVAGVTGLSFLPALVLGGLAGAGVAALVGLPALRLPGLVLAVSTLALAVSVTTVLLDPDALGRHLPENGLGTPSLLGIGLDDQRASYGVTLLVLVLAVAAVTGLRRSRTARVLVAARDNEAAAQAFGISLLRARLQAFAVSGALAGVAGALLAFQQGSVTVDAFAPETSLLVFTWAVIGGLGSVTGPLVGFAALAAVSVTTTSPGISAFVNGFGGLALLLLAPGGLAQVGWAVRDAWLRRTVARLRLDVPGWSPAGATEPAPIAPPRGHVPGRYALDGQWATTREARAAADARAVRP